MFHYPIIFVLMVFGAGFFLFSRRWAQIYTQIKRIYLWNERQRGAAFRLRRWNVEKLRCLKPAAFKACISSSRFNFKVLAGVKYAGQILSRMILGDFKGFKRIKKGIFGITENTEATENTEKTYIVGANPRVRPFFYWGGNPAILVSWRLPIFRYCNILGAVMDFKQHTSPMVLKSAYAARF